MTIWCPSPAELDDLDLLLHGAYRPLTGFLSADENTAVERDGRLPDGTPWPVPITLTVPDAVAGDTITVQDEQRTPVAELTVVSTYPAGDGRTGVAGPVRRIGVRERADGIAPPTATPGPSQPVLGLPMIEPPHLPELVAVAAAARELGARVRVLPLVGHGMPTRVDGPALVRACIGAADELAALGTPAEVLAVALPRHHAVVPDRDRELAARVAVALGVTHLPEHWGGDVTVPDVVLDARSDEWTPAGTVPPEHRGELAAHAVADHVVELVSRGRDVPPSLSPGTTTRELRRAARPSGHGVTVLFTGLSGSGKSTIANAVHAALAEHTDRTVTLLDGDVVRTMLSSELGFSREHRELNVRRIGFVAAEVTRHGGVALCAPIAPYASVRAEVRAMVERHGRFVLVHVSTPLDVCEARDRKGLYAKARRGEIPEFTGISDPYEEPTDAELTIDASRVPVEDTVRQVLGMIGV